MSYGSTEAKLAAAARAPSKGFMRPVFTLFLPRKGKKKEKKVLPHQQWDCVRNKNLSPRRICFPSKQESFCIRRTVNRRPADANLQPKRWESLSIMHKLGDVKQFFSRKGDCEAETCFAVSVPVFPLSSRSFLYADLAACKWVLMPQEKL